MKRYTVSIELQCVEISVNAESIADAKKKAIEKLNKKKPSSLIDTRYADGRHVKKIWVDEHE